MIFFEIIPKLEHPEPRLAPCNSDGPVFCSVVEGVRNPLPKPEDGFHQGADRKADAVVLVRVLEINYCGSLATFFELQKSVRVDFESHFKEINSAMEISHLVNNRVVTFYFRRCRFPRVGAMRYSVV